MAYPPWFPRVIFIFFTLFIFKEYSQYSLLAMTPAVTFKLKLLIIYIFFHMKQVAQLKRNKIWLQNWMLWRDWSLIMSWSLSAAVASAVSQWYDAMERTLRHRGCGINCKCRGIVRNDIWCEKNANLWNYGICQDILKRATSKRLRSCQKLAFRDKLALRY